MQGGNVVGHPLLRGRHGSLVQRVLSALLSHDFRVVDYTDVRGCVDIVARRQDEVYVVRILSNVDSLREESVEELVRLARAVGGTPIIVGEKTKRERLSSGVVYRRYGVAVVTVDTFDSILSGDLPTVEEYKGKKVVFLDPEKLRAARLSLGLSQNELAREVGTTKDSIYRYEHGFPASESIAKRLQEILGKEITAPVDLSLQSENKEDMYRFRRAPWDLYISSRVSIALSHLRGVVQRKIEILRRGKGIAHDLYAVISDKPLQNVPTVSPQELEESTPKDIAKRVEEEYEEF